MNCSTKLTSRALMVLLAAGVGPAKADDASFYKEPPLFSTPRRNRPLSPEIANQLTF